MIRKFLKGKIAYCDNRHLKGLQHKKGGHYVYVRKVKSNGLCDVNVITSLEKGPYEFKNNRLAHVRKGNTYPIPYYDCNFSRWSGVTKTPIKNVGIRHLQGIGQKYIRRRHQFYIGKYCQ